MSKKYLVTGSKGLVGSSVIRKLKEIKAEFITVSRSECDISDYSAFKDYAIKYMPDTIINCAALVGGIQANIKRPFDFFSINTAIQCNVMRYSCKYGVKDLVLINSNCCYPKKSIQPYREIDFMSGEPESSNYGYAIAKRSGLQGALSLEDQYRIKTYHPVPCSLYGENDNFNVHNSHFIGAAIRKIYEAKEVGSKSIEFWGTGTPKREYMHVDDAVDGIFHMLKKKISGKPVNICCGKEYPIKYIIQLLSQFMEYEGKILWDTKKPDGAQNKLQDPALINKSGWSPNIKLEDGLRKTVNWFLNTSNKRL